MSAEHGRGHFENGKGVNPGVAQEGVLHDVDSARVDMAELHGLVEQKLVKVTRHPDPSVQLSVFNYSEQTRDRGLWTPLSERCRGLIVNDEGLIMARPFSRIKDLEPGEELPEGPFTVYEKLDGSLGIQYDLNGQPNLATRGAFTDSRGRTRLADATEKLRSFDYPFNPEVTYLWEIVDPEHPLVVDYGDTKGIILLGTIETATGRDLPLPDQGDVPFPVVPGYTDIQTTEELRVRVERPNTEGFVIRMDETGERFRIKSEGYAWKNDIRKGVAARHVWQRLSGGEGYDAFNATLPQDVREEVGEIATVLQRKYKGIRSAARSGMAYRKIEQRRQAGEDVAPLIWEIVWREAKKEFPQPRR